MSLKSEVAKRIDAHGEAVWRIPSGEQFIGAIQSVVSIALKDIARWVETVEAAKAKPKARRKGRQRTRGSA